MKKKKLFLIPLAMFMAAGTVGLAGCEEAKKDDPSGPVDPEVTLSSIEVTTAPTKVVYQVGEQLDLTGMVVTAKYSDESEKVVTDYTVDKAGVALQETDTVVTVSYGGQTAAFNITVTSGEVVDVTGIKYTIAKYTIEIGETLEIGIEIEPEDATVKDVTYELSAEGIVSIEDNIITGLAEGSVDITIKSVSNPEVSKKISGFKVKKADVQAPAATAAGFNKFTEGELKNGETINIAAIYGDKIYGMGALAGTFITPTELSVDGDGKLVVGEALNYKALLNNDGTYSLKDSAGKYLSLAASGNNIAIKEAIDEDCKFVIGHGENATTTIVGANTSKDSRFLVYNAGNPRFSFYKESTAATYPQLIVYHDGQEAEHKDVTGVEFKAESYDVFVGKTINVVAGVIPADATDQEITYSLKDVEPAGCATISGNVITGVAAGTAKVVATTHDGEFTAEVPLTVSVDTVNYGTETSPLTVTEALAIINDQCKNSGEFTRNEIYCTGLVSVLGSEQTYGYKNTKISDGTNEVLVYSLNLNAEQKAAYAVGKTVVFHGYATNYSGTMEFSTYNDNVYVTASYVGDPVVNVTGVTLDKESLTLEAETAAVELVPTVAPDNATNKNVSWTSSDETVATVDNGFVTPVAEGSAVITVTTADGGKTAECAVTVTAATKTLTGITVTGPTKTEYHVGDLLDLEGLVVTAHYDDESTETITTGYTTNIALDHKLESTDTSLVITYKGFDAEAITLTINEAARQALPYTVDASGGAFAGWESSGTGAFATNLIKLDTVGDYVQAVKLFDKRPSVKVMVDSYLNGTGKDPSEIKISALNDDGETVASESYEPLQKSASSESAGRTAGEEGRVAFTFSGTDISGLKIEATVKTANLVLTKVQVVEPPVLVSSVTFDEHEISLEYPGSGATLNATVLPENASDKEVEWSVEGSSVSVVDGVITTIGVGDSTVTATAKDGSGKADSCVVHVAAKSAVLESITIDGEPTSTSYFAGATYSTEGLTVTAHYDDESTGDITALATITINKEIAELGDESITYSVEYEGKNASKSVNVTVSEAPVADVVETLTVASLGIGSGYGNFSKLSSSGILFQGNATTSNDGGIQIRDTGNGSGIYSRTSGRLVKSVKFEFDSANGKTISVYGQETGYTEIKATPDGTLLGSLTADGTITVTESVKNICIVSTGATYIKNIVVTYEGGSVTPSVSGVVLDKETADLGAGEDLTLNAIVEGLGCTQVVDWESSDESKATVVNGVVHGVDAGEVTITAKSHDDNSKFAQCVVNVTNEKTLMCADFTTKSASHGVYNDSWDYGDFTLTNAANNNGGWDYMKFGKKSATQTCSVVNKNASTQEITKIVVDIYAGSIKDSKQSCTEWGVEVYSDSEMTHLVDKVVSTDVITKNAASFTLKPSEGVHWAAGSYFKIYFNTSDTGSANGVVLVSKISYIG